MNIAVITGSDLYAGGGFQQELSTILLLRKNISSKYNFIFFSTSKKNIDILRKYDVELIYLRFTYFDRKINYVRRNKYINRFVRNFGLFKYNRFDNILLNNEIDLIYFLNPSSLALETEIHNYIITVWDLCHRDHMEFPEVGNSGVFWGRENLYAHALPKAVAVIAESELGRKNIIWRYNIDEDRVVSLPHLPSNSVNINNDDYQANYIDIKEKYNIKGNYIFYPAQFWSHKNHIYILESLKLLHKKHKIKINAVFSGNDTGNLHYILQKAREYEISEHIFYIGFVNIEEIPYLYKQSLALVMPTYFGPTNLPPLEAFTLECPVCYSDLPGLRDQVKDAAFLLDLTKPETLVDALLNISTNNSLKTEKIEKGKLLVENLNEGNYWQGLKSIFDKYLIKMKCWKS